MRTVYRTAKFKVHNPSGRKLRRCKRAQARYSRAYADVLWGLRNDESRLDAVENQSEKAGKAAMREALDGQPFRGAMWDGLYKDLTQSLSSWRENDDANYPAPHGTATVGIDELVDELVRPNSREREEELKWEVKRKGTTYTRPILFDRFRDCPIIRSNSGEKLWIAPHLPARTDGNTGALPSEAQSIRSDNWSYSSDTWHHTRQTNKECLPIECGRWHMVRFFRDGTPTSCKLEVTEDDIFVHYAFAFDVPSRRPHRAVMGIDRGEAVVAAYSIIGMDGRVRTRGSSAPEAVRERLSTIDDAIDERQAAGKPVSKLWAKRRHWVQDVMHRVGNRIVELAAKHRAIIAFEDLSNLRGGKTLNQRQWGRLAEFVEYRADESGLWTIDDVFPAYTSRTCSACGHEAAENRVSRSEFVCRSCGVMDHADLNASTNIATRALWRVKGGRKTGADTWRAYTRSLTNRRRQTEAPSPS